MACSTSWFRLVDPESLTALQLVTRPSEFVLPSKVLVLFVGVMRLRDTAMLAAGLPVEVSRTWQVINGLSFDILTIGLNSVSRRGFVSYMTVSMVVVIKMIVLSIMADNTSQTNRLPPHVTITAVEHE